MGSKADTTDGSGSRRRRWTAAEGLALAEDWRSSGLCVAEYARTRRVPAHRLSYWSRRAEAGRAAAPSAAEFVALTVDAPPSAARCDEERGGDRAVEVRVGERMSVRVPIGLGRESFMETIRWVVAAVDV